MHPNLHHLQSQVSVLATYMLLYYILIVSVHKENVPSYAPPTPPHQQVDAVIIWDFFGIFFDASLLVFWSVAGVLFLVLQQSTTWHHVYEIAPPPPRLHQEHIIQVLVFSLKG